MGAPVLPVEEKKKNTPQNFPRSLERSFAGHFPAAPHCSGRGAKEEGLSGERREREEKDNYLYH